LLPEVATQVVPVTVIIPSYRRKHYLVRAVASVRAQEGVRPMEIIVVDDGSKDGTAEVARSLGARVIEKADNEGLSAARDDAVAAAEGAEWVATLDDDDEWLPHHLQTVWAKRGSHVLVAGTSLSFGAGTSRTHGTATDVAEVVRSPARLMFPENSYTPSATIVRRDVLLKCGGFDRSLGYLEDLDAWLRVLELGTGLLLPDITCLYRLHEGQVSRHREQMLAASKTVTDKYAGRPWLTPAVCEDLAVVEAWDDFYEARQSAHWATAGAKALWIGSRPRRLGALARLWVFRRRTRHRLVPADVARRAEVSGQLEAAVVG
jgi:glycosyltransferase involved in cell wall biosynthesis